MQIMVYSYLRNFLCVQKNTSRVVLHNDCACIRTRVYIYIYTSGKNFIKITSVGMGAAKSNETR